MKILIIKPSSFGDIVQALPCANAFKKVYNRCEISWVVFNVWYSIIKICKDVDKIIMWDREGGLKGFFDVLRKINKIEYDLVVDLQGLFRSALLAKFTRAKLKLGVHGMKELSRFLIKEIHSENIMMNATFRNLEPVYFLTGKKFFPEVNIEINTMNSDKILRDNGVFGKFISFVPFARGKGKNWSIFNYNELADLIKKEYFDTQVVILGTMKDFGKINSDKIVDLCGKTKIEDLAGILMRSKVSIGSDTGPMHLSSILQTPSIFIFGNSDINKTVPGIGKFSAFLNNSDFKNIDNIKPKIVMAEIKKLIN
ncbi:MAG: glycosyltransferase family 9 protein [Endomicrobium sp.]|jgi:ADP-heptose:LPS heptosyltransferase|nr:glycosyltransferase family 9 protein [Endomicrobium sp.]